ncbi:MAG TPA: hypothetical protein VHP37_09490 [Burkholderiales bacterium]|nr:hypothetical protein [Burkholderiales bacterium]
MEREQALKILNALANGVHPATGELFGADSPYQHPDTVRALVEAVRVMEGSPRERAAAERRGSLPANNFLRWSSEEEERLAAGFDGGKTPAELAQLHNRSLAAIEARLLKLGKIDVAALTVRLHYKPKGTESGDARE